MIIKYEDIIDDFNDLENVTKFIGLKQSISLPEERKIIKLSNEVNENIYKKFHKDGGFSTKDKFNIFKMKMKETVKHSLFS